MNRKRMDWIARMRIMMITDGLGRSNAMEGVERALKAGVTVIQLREKSRDAPWLWETGARLRALTRSYQALLMINHHLDLAEAVEADGVHLGWESVSPVEARRRLGPDRLIGLSTHSIREILDADAEVDYCQLGPVFPTPSKQGLVSALGLETLRQAVNESKRPIVAVGGVDIDRAASIIATGVSGVAAIRGLAIGPVEDLTKACHRAFENRGPAKTDLFDRERAEGQCRSGIQPSETK